MNCKQTKQFHPIIAARSPTKVLVSLVFLLSVVCLNRLLAVLVGMCVGGVIFYI